MNWYAIEKDYINYLKKYDKLISDVEYPGRLKCFIGIVLVSDNGINYFAPLTSYKSKFESMQNNIDFYKIIDNKGKIYGAVNINNMFPVPNNIYTEITYENLDKFREFKNTRDKKSYWKLLNKEMSLIKEEVLINNTKELITIVKKFPNSRIAKRCCKFSLLEEKCMQYKK